MPSTRPWYIDLGWFHTHKLTPRHTLEAAPAQLHPFAVITNSPSAENMLQSAEPWALQQQNSLLLSLCRCIPLLVVPPGAQHLMNTYWIAYSLIVICALPHFPLFSAPASWFYWMDLDIWLYLFQWRQVTFWENRRAAELQTTSYFQVSLKI